VQVIRNEALCLYRLVRRVYMKDIRDTGIENHRSRHWLICSILP